LSVFRDFEVRYLVVGGYAVMRYTEPRHTKDLDLWIAIDVGNATRTFNALRAFGAPLKGLSPTDFTQPDCFYQMGVSPLRVDIMMSIPAVSFEDAWPRRDEVVVGELRIPFVSREDLLRSQKSGGRPQDAIDAQNLEMSRGRDRN
jgi:hypothetical protein